MSSTSNAQNLLVNVVRPTYKWEAGTGFVPSLVVSNVSELIAGRVKTSALVVSDSNVNTYIGSDAGVNASNTLSNVGIGFSAMGGALNATCNVAIGTFALDGLSNSDCNVALGAGTDISGSGVRNVLIGTNVTLTTGSNNILIGVDLSRINISNTLQIGPLLYGDLSQGYLGVNTSAPAAPLDVSGIVVFRNKVGVQTALPNYSLDVAGSLYVSSQVLTSRGTTSAPVYSFDSNKTSGLYQPTDASYGTAAVGVVVNSTPRLVVADLSTYIYGGLDVCGTVRSSGGSASFLAARGQSNLPTYAFSADTSLGLYLTTDASGAALGIAVGGQRRLVVGSNKLTMFGNLDVCGVFSAASGGGGGGGGGTVASNGTAATPSFTFSNDLSTGLHLEGTSILAFDTSGRQRMTLSNGFLGIGTATPRVALDVSGDISANVYNGPGGTQSAPHYTFSDDRTTGVFFPGANIVGFTAGGTERMRISNGNVGIGTRAPTNALDVSGTLRVIGTTGGDITFTNGAIAIAGSTVVSSTGVLSNSAGTVNSIGGVVLENSNVMAATFESSPATSNLIGGSLFSNYTIQAGDGVAGGPGFAFLNETNTGIYRGSPFTLGVAVNGTNSAIFSNTSIDLRPAGTPTLLLAGGQTQVMDGTAALPSLTFANEPAMGLYRVNTGQIGFVTGGTQRMVLSNANVGIGTSSPGYRLDVCGGAGTPSINLATWPRIPLSNALLVKGVPGNRVGNTLNFNTTVRNINSTLATFVASNATNGSSLLINRAGIWSIMLVGSTGDGTQLWMDVSTNNHSNITQYTNGNPVLSIAFTPGTGTSNNTTCTFMGFLPSNIFVKPRINGNLGPDGDVVWRFNALFHAETDAVSTWPF